MMIILLSAGAVAAAAFCFAVARWIRSECDEV